MRVSNLPNPSVLRDTRQLRDSDTFEEFRLIWDEFSTQINYIMKNLSLEGNFNTDIVQFTIPSGQELEVSHKLNVIPKYRVILGSEGNGVLSDVRGKWDNRYVYFFNHGPQAITVTLALHKE